MALFARIRTQILSWSQDTPLPADTPDAVPVFQAWCEFNSSTKKWSHVHATCTNSTTSNIQQRTDQGSKLVLVTWNVDSSSALPQPRFSGIISHIMSLAPAADIIFFQEVSRAALEFLLDDPWIREFWFSSDVDCTSWEGQPFASMTLLSRTRFGYRNESLLGEATIGPVWRVKYPSRFGRNALCCDVFVPSLLCTPTAPASAYSTPASATTRIRLVNVHLDSLPIRPSHRPRQISIISSILRSAGRGIVAGDFNPVLPEDETLIKENRLVDAWAELRPEDPGFTWGIDGKQPFPPNRLDKVAVLGLKVQDIEVMNPGVVTHSNNARERRQAMDDPTSPEQKHDLNEPVPWSDHSGLRCSFGQFGH